MSVPYSESARHALDRARAEALALGHGEVSTEHILLGLLGDEADATVRALTALGARPEAIRAELIIEVATQEDPREGEEVESAAATPPSFTAWLAAALTHASAEASVDRRPIEVTDFLLALAEDAQSPAGWVLAELGVESERLRATAEHLRLLEREIARVGREMHDAAAAQQLDRAGELRDQRKLLIAQRQRRAAPPAGDGDST